MRRTMVTLGEQKTAACLWCEAVFLAKRYDAKFCCREHATRWHAKHQRPWKDYPNRVVANAKRMARYYETRETSIANSREWHAAHREEANSKRKAHYHANKAHHLAKAREWQRAHPVEMKAKRIQHRQNYQWANALSGARKRALMLGLPFDLTREWAIATWTGLCAISGLPFVLGKPGDHWRTPSIDRIIPDVGYKQDNCRFVLFGVNALKGTGTDKEMFEVAKAIVANSPLLFCEPPDNHSDIGTQYEPPPNPHTHAPELDLALTKS